MSSWWCRSLDTAALEAAPTQFFRSLHPRTPQTRHHHSRCASALQLLQCRLAKDCAPFHVGLWQVWAALKLGRTNAGPLLCSPFAALCCFPIRCPCMHRTRTQLCPSSKLVWLTFWCTNAGDSTGGAAAPWRFLFIIAFPATATSRFSLESETTLHMQAQKALAQEGASDGSFGGRAAHGWVSPCVWQVLTFVSALGNVMHRSLPVSLGILRLRSRVRRYLRACGVRHGTDMMHTTVLSKG